MPRNPRGRVEFCGTTFRSTDWDSLRTRGPLVDCFGSRFSFALKNAAQPENNCGAVVGKDTHLTSWQGHPPPNNPTVTASDFGWPRKASLKLETLFQNKTARAATKPLKCFKIMQLSASNAKKWKSHPQTTQFNWEMMTKYRVSDGCKYNFSVCFLVNRYGLCHIFSVLAPVVIRIFNFLNIGGGKEFVDFFSTVVDQALRSREEQNVVSVHFSCFVTYFFHQAF